MHPTTHRATSPRSRSDDGPSDEALLLGLGHGDPGAGITFVRRYQGRVYGLAHTIVANPTHAEEIAQETLIRAWRHAHSYDPRRGSVSTWVLTITRNLAVDTLRRKGAQPADPRAAIFLDQPAHGSMPEDAATVTDETIRVRTALSASTRANSDGPSSSPPSTAIRPERSARPRQSPWARPRLVSVGVSRRCGRFCVRTRPQRVSNPRTPTTAYSSPTTINQ